MKRFLLALATSFLLVAMAGFAAAQTETGQISGKVTDPNGAVVPNATVKATNTNTGTQKTTQANDAGEYIFTNLQPGRYEVTASGGSFQPTKVTVELTVGAKTSAEIKMGIPQVAGEVNVVAAGGVEVNTTSQEMSNVINSTQIRELPTLTRNPYDLATIGSNVSSKLDATSADAQAGATSRGVGVAINGQRASSTNILLDGGENVDTFTSTVGQSVPLDSVGEFRIITSNFSAEYGRASGGIVNVATISGTNSFHGTGYEFYRGARFASNGFDNNANALRRSPFVRNQFGYSIGGPIKKNKLFFFSSTEWTRVRSNASQINTILAPEFLARADVSAKTKAALGGYALASNVQLGEVLQTITLNSVTTPLYRAVRFSVPSDVGAGNPQNTYQTVARIDWNKSSSTQFYGRFAFESINLFDGSISSSPWAGFNSGETDRNQNWLVSLTHNFSPNLVSQSKLVYNRLNDLQPLSTQPVGPTFFLTNTAFQQISGHNVAFPGYLPYTPGNGIPFGGPQNLGQGYEDLSWTHGSHTTRFGGQYVYIQDNRSFGAYEEATEAIGKNPADAVANLITGNVLQFQVAVFPQGKFPGGTLNLPVGPPQFTRSNRYSDWALYLNDSWRYNSRVTFNLGVRYEYYGVQHNKDQTLDSNFYFGTGASFFEQIRNGSVQIAPNSPVGGLWKSVKNSFAPRLGFAIDLTGDGRNSVRGGYGRSFERNFGNVTFNVIQNPPNYAVVSITAPGDFPSIDISRSNFGPLAGNVGTKVLPISSLRAVDPNIKPAFADFWSFAFEHEMTRGTVFSAEYSGSHGSKLYDIANINRLGSGLLYLGSTVTRPDTGGQSNRLNGQYSNINFRGQHGFSNYNGISFSLESSGLRQRHLKNLQFTVRYTLSHAKDNLSTTFSESLNNGSFVLGYVDPFNPKLDYGDADFDARHRFVTSFNWNLPVGEGSHGIARHALGGWALTGIFQARTGTPFSVYDCGNSDGTFCMRMLQVASGLAFTGPSNPAPAGDPNRFNFIDLRPQLPGAGSFSDPITHNGGLVSVGPFPPNMTKRNAFRSPGFWNLDFGLYKSFRVTERFKLQLRSEYYNIFNHANLYVSGSDADIVEVDQVHALKSGRRHIQFAAKLIF